MTDPNNQLTDETLSDEAEGAQEVDRDLAELYEQVERASTERDQLKDQLMRTMADFQNFRKRTADEKRAIQELANENLIRDLLPVLDSFERGLASMESAKDVSVVAEGIRAIERQFRATLEANKVTKIPSVGQPFDPDLHDAIATVETPDSVDGTIVDEVEAGY